MPKTSENIQPIKNQYAHHGRHEVKDLQQIHECKDTNKDKTSTHEANLEPPKNYR